MIRICGHTLSVCMVSTGMSSKYAYQDYDSFIMSYFGHPDINSFLGFLKQLSSVVMSYVVM